MQRFSVSLSRFGLAAVLGLLVLTSQAARVHAVTVCTKSWASAVDGLWSDAAKWSPLGIPQVSDDVCINVEGSYTVDFEGSGTVNTLAIGAPSATLDIGGVDTSLTLANGMVNSGTVRLLSGTCGKSSTLTVTNGTLTNEATGTLHMINCGQSTIAAAMVNNGTLNVGTNGPAALITKQDTVHTNNGNIVVQGSSHLAISGLNQTFNQNGGTVTLNSYSTFNISNAATFSFFDGTITGTGLLSVVNARLDFAGAGGGGRAGTIYARGNSTLTGDVPSLVTVNIVDSPSATLTSATGFTNFGTIVLTSNGCSSNATLAVTNGTLTNAVSGTISLSICGTATIQAQLANNGTLNASSSGQIAKPNAVHTNGGTINIGSSCNFAIAAANQTLSSSGVISGTGFLQIYHDASYEGTGTIGAHVVNHGRMSVGGAMTGILNITNANSNAFAQGTDGRLDLRIGGLTLGSGYDQLHVAGGAQLNGELDVTILAPYVPAGGSSYQVITSGTRTGSFAALNATGLRLGQLIVPTYGATDVTLRIHEPLTSPNLFLPLLLR